MWLCVCHFTQGLGSPAPPPPPTHTHPHTPLPHTYTPTHTHLKVEWEVFLVLVGLVQLVLREDDDLTVRPHVIARSESAITGGQSCGSGCSSTVSGHCLLSGACGMTWEREGRSRERGGGKREEERGEGRGREGEGKRECFYHNCIMNMNLISYIVLSWAIPNLNLVINIRNNFATVSQSLQLCTTTSAKQLPTHTSTTPTGPGSPYKLPTSSRTGTLTSSFGPPAYS